MTTNAVMTWPPDVKLRRTSVLSTSFLLFVFFLSARVYLAGFGGLWAQGRHSLRVHSLFFSLLRGGHHTALPCQMSNLESHPLGGDEDSDEDVEHVKAEDFTIKVTQVWWR